MDSYVKAGISGGVLTVTINRVEKHNALSRAILTEIGAVFERFAPDPDVAVAVLTGAGDRSFAAGGDLRELSAVRSADEAMAFSVTAYQALDRIRRFPLPVIAALNGDALGGGAELALACDLRIASSGARIGFLQSKLNIATAWGGGDDLVGVVGAARALELLCTARIVDGMEAVAWGLFSARAAPGERFDAFVSGFVAPYAAQRPLVMRAFKALCVARRCGMTPADRANSESVHFVPTWTSGEHWAAAELALDRMKRA
jgi:enoyl-CoA hydratase